MKDSFKKDLIIWLLIVFAIASFITGLLVPLCKHKNSFDDTFMGSFFSLAGVFMFSAALMYQIREYKLQVEELKKSVDAQTSSSHTLEQQRQLMVEQNTNEYIFKLIENFNHFKDNGIVHNRIKNIDDFFTHFLDQIPQHLSISKEEAAEVFAHKLIIDFQLWYLKTIEKEIITNYTQFAFNVFETIEKFAHVQAGFFLTLFHNQFTQDEKIILFLMNSIPTETSHPKVLDWKYPHVCFILNDKLRNLPQKYREIIDNNDFLDQLIKIQKIQLNS